MEIDGFLADSVVGAEGKLYVQGAGWNQLFVRNVPVQHDRIGIGLLVNVPYTATNQNHSFEIKLEDEDGHSLPIGDAPPEANLPDGKIRAFGGTFNVGRPPSINPGERQIVPIALNLSGLMLAKVGNYSFVVYIDGTPVKRLSFRVSQLPQAAPVLR